MYIRVALYFNEGGKECYFDHFEITFLKIFILVLTSRELNLKKKKGPLLSFFFIFPPKKYRLSEGACSALRKIIQWISPTDIPKQFFNFLKFELVTQSKLWVQHQMRLPKTFLPNIHMKKCQKPQKILFFFLDLLSRE